MRQAQVYQQKKGFLPSNLHKTVLLMLMLGAGLDLAVRQNPTQLLAHSPSYFVLLLAKENRSEKACG